MGKISRKEGWKAGSIKGKLGIVEQRVLNGWRLKGGIDYEKR